MLDLQPSSFEDFEREARQGNVVPVVRSIMADLHTAVGAFMSLAGDSAYAFLLESVEGGERIARYSFFGTEPEMIVRGRGSQTFVERNGKTETHPMVATEWVREYFRQRILARRPGLLPFAGGAVGYLEYDAAHWFEPALRSDGAEPQPAAEEQLQGQGIPEGIQERIPEGNAVWMFYRNVIAFDRLRQRMEIVSIVLTEEAEGSHARLRELYQEAVTRTEQVEAALLKGIAPQGATQAAQAAQPKSEKAEIEPESNWTRSGFEDGVRRIQEYIAAGACYRVVLSQQFSAEFTGQPIAIYRALRATSPSPYMFYLGLGAETIMGASSEMLVRCHGQRLDYRPIAGARKRGATETEDWMMGEDLLTDEKEVAEHTMLVDLGRNDLGRVADYGSVNVEELMAIERYSHVQQIVTSLRARLRDGLDRFDALASCFPGGSVTGAPKLRAMEIIRELEPNRRGVHAGAVLYVDFADSLDSCIAIRTIVLRDGKASVQAGAGIVADSLPDQEYADTVQNARRLFRAIELAERGL